MKLMIDCTPLSKGGGVQAAIAFLELLRVEAYVQWCAVIPENMRTVLPKSIEKDHRVFFYKKRGLFGILNLRCKLIEMERQFQPSVVFTVFGPAYFKAKCHHVIGFALPKLIYSSEKKLIWWTKNNFLFHFLRKILVRRADQWLVETNTVRIRLSQYVGIDLDKIFVIPNCVNPLLEYSESPSEDNSESKFKVFVPSAWYSHKNLDIIPYVAEVMNGMVKKRMFEFVLTLDPQSKEWAAIRTRSCQLGVSDMVVTVGVVPIEKLSIHYLNASCVYLPTSLECSTAVYPEAFFFKRPLITSDMDFARELCGEAALFVPPRDVNKTATQLLRLAEDRVLRDSLIVAGSYQLASRYPSSKIKFQQQLAALGVI